MNGIATTQDSTSFCPDSASTATSFSCGVKIHSGVIGKLVDKTKDAKNLSEYFKEQGWKIGIVSTVTLNHATPAANAKGNPLVLTQSEYKKLQNAFAESKLSSEEQSKRQKEDEDIYRLYGGYDPISVSVTHILNNKAGIGWTSYAHTGTPVAVHAYGAASDVFGGSYDNTDIFFKTLQVTGVNQ